jgi:UDP-N-acetylmuramate--alanine ligase
MVVFVGAGDIDKTAREWIAAAKARIGRSQAWDTFAESVRSLVSGATKVTREEPLAARTTLRVGGTARVYAEPAGEDDLRHVLSERPRRPRSPVFILGRGSNLIIPDEGVEGLVISLGHKAWSSFEKLADGRVRVGAGLRLKNLCGLAATAGSPVSSSWRAYPEAWGAP